MKEKTYQLLLAARQGDEEAFLTLFKQYHPVIFAIQSKYHLRGFEPEDWLQEGGIVFTEVVNKFDPSHGFTLGNFYKMTFNHHIVNLLRKQSSWKRRADLLSFPVEHVFEENLNGRFSEKDPSPLAIDQMILKESFADYPTILSPSEGLVISCYLKGCELEEIEEMLGNSKSAVCSALYRGKRKLIRCFRDKKKPYM